MLLGANLKIIQGNPRQAVPARPPWNNAHDLRRPGQTSWQEHPQNQRQGYYFRGKRHYRRVGHFGVVSIGKAAAKNQDSLH